VIMFTTIDLYKQ